MLSKLEIVGISLSMLCMAVALYLIRVETSLLTTASNGAQASQLASSGIVVVGDGENVEQERKSALLNATDGGSKINNISILVHRGVGGP